MSRYSDHRKSKAVLNEIDQNRHKYLIIHYACESFFDTNGATPRITSIAVKNFENGQTDLFAIHKIAELHGISFDQIINNYTMLEKELLTNFFDFVDKHTEKIWIHWNMRDSNFGFKAIEQRYRVLKGSPTIIPDDHKIDLSSLFIKLYGKGYINNPRILSLMSFNHIRPHNFLDGKQEADAFAKEKFVELSFSNSSKVDLFSNFLVQCIDGKLKTKSKFFETYGNIPIGIYDWALEKPTGKFIFWIINLLIGGFIGAWISNLVS